MIDDAPRDRGAGHSEDDGGLLVLRHRLATGDADRRQPLDAVGAHAGENDAHRPARVGRRS